MEKMIAALIVSVALLAGTPAQAERRYFEEPGRFMLPSDYAFLAGTAVDLHSTWLAMGEGRTELNPVLTVWGDSREQVILTAAALRTVFWFAMRGLRDKYPKVANGILWGVSFMSGGAAIHNYQQVRW